MKKRLIWFLSAAAFACILRLSYGFCAFWAAKVSPGLLHIAAKIGGLFPFSLLEWGLVLYFILLSLSLIFQLRKKGFRAAVRRFFRRIFSLALAALTAFLAIWFPLCLTRSGYSVTADSALLQASCERLIRELNAAQPDFSGIRLPTKYAAFPVWMDIFGLSGFCSFFTGEALISPRLDPAGAPFTAVHENMHLRGIADEGMTNIEAYRECMKLGGAYACSAKLWALKYTLGILRKTDAEAFYACREKMNGDTARCLRSIGGDALPSPPQPAAIYAFSGIDPAMNDYEVLAYWLAAEGAQ